MQGKSHTHFTIRPALKVSCRCNYLQKVASSPIQKLLWSRCALVHLELLNPTNVRVTFQTNELSSLSFVSTDFLQVGHASSASLTPGLLLDSQLPWPSQWEIWELGLEICFNTALRRLYVWSFCKLLTFSTLTPPLFIRGWRENIVSPKRKKKFLLPHYNMIYHFRYRESHHFTWSHYLARKWSF